MSSVSAVVVVHERLPELERCLDALAPQVDELVVVDNLGRGVEVPAGARVIENERPVGYAANANLGAAATTAPFVIVCNPDTIAEPDAVATLLEFVARRPRCGIAAPELRYPDGTWQPTRRRFPTVVGTLVRRSPLRRLLPMDRFHRRHYLLDERPTDSVEADWLLGAFLMLRREMLDELGGFDEGFRLYGEDIDLAYRAAKAGWERWYVPAAHVTHDYAAAIDRVFFSLRTLWHLRSMARFVRKHPERLRAL